MDWGKKKNMGMEGKSLEENGKKKERDKRGRKGKKRKHGGDENRGEGELEECNGRTNSGNSLQRWLNRREKNPTSGRG